MNPKENLLKMDELQLVRLSRWGLI